MTKDIDNLEKRIDNIGKNLEIILKKLDDIRPYKREKHDKKRVQKYISFEPKQYKWIEENIKTWKFAGFSHAVEWGLYVLKEKLDKEKF